MTKPPQTNGNDNINNVLIRCFLVVNACYLAFLLSFFPIHKPVPDFAKHQAIPEWLMHGNTSGNSSYPSPPVICKFVLLVIDALRTDFVLDEDSDMKYLKELQQKNEALTFVAKTHPPTVTLPRIKAITTGSIPGFVDIVLNFDSKKLVDDNILTQMKRTGRNILFYGDDTWISLFPNHFIRSEGTSSFFVADFTEVDNNVTRYIPDELSRSDWDVLILHYLGLDHIGHLAGPKSPLIGPKLKEMDDIIQTIYKSLLYQNQSLPFLLVVCGDHGMSDQGSHGGASSSEIQVPVVFISPAVKTCSNLKDDDKIHQIDLAPTLSILLGLPIPQNSLGHVITEVLFGCSIEEKVKALWMNSQQILKVLQHNVPNYENEPCYIQCQIAFSSHSDWLKNKKPIMSDSSSEQHGYQIIEQYKDCLVAMSTKISSSLTKYHMYGMVVSIILLWMVFILVLFTAIQTQYPSAIKQHLPIALSSSVLAVFGHVTVCTSQSNHSDILCQNSPLSWLLQAILLLCFFWICLQLSGLVHNASCAIKPGDVTSVFLLLGTVLHIISLLSSSLVEEEHQTWYFYSVSIHMLMLTKFFSRLISNENSPQKFVHMDINTALKDSKHKMYDQPDSVFSEPRQSPSLISSRHIKYSDQICEEDSKSFKICKKWSCHQHIDANNYQLVDRDTGSVKSKAECLTAQKTDRMSIVKNIASVLCVLVLSRLARSWNQTGNKWLDRPDIGDWISRPEKKLFLSVTVALSLMSLVLARWRQMSFVENVLFTAGCLTVYMFRSATGELYFPGLYLHPNKGLKEAWLVYVLVTLLIIRSIWEKWKVQGWFSAYRMYSSLQSACTLLMALLLRTYNIPLVAIVTFQELLINQFLPSCGLSVISLSLYCWWMGQATFFYQGNSNSITTVDVSAGFVGVGEYYPLFIGILMALVTYIGPIFWFLVLMKYICRNSEQGSSEERNSRRLQNSVQVTCNWLLLFRTLTLAVYVVTVTFQRYHLFVWTVFSPKLLYEGCLTLVTSILCIVTMVSS